MGLRFEGEQAFGKPTFYLLPGINLRGIPAGRYQGKTSFWWVKPNLDGIYTKDRVLWAILVLQVLSTIGIKLLLNQ
jgi:hypothetical protein